MTDRESEEVSYEEWEGVPYDPVPLISYYKSMFIWDEEEFYHLIQVDEERDPSGSYYENYKRAMTHYYNIISIIDEFDQEVLASGIGEELTEFMIEKSSELWSTVVRGWVGWGRFPKFHKGELAYKVLYFDLGDFADDLQHVEAIYPRYIKGLKANMDEYKHTAMVNGLLR